MHCLLRMSLLATKQGEGMRLGARWHLMSVTPSPMTGPLAVLFQVAQQPVKDLNSLGEPLQLGIPSHSW